MVADLSQMFLEIIQSFFAGCLIPRTLPPSVRTECLLNKNGFSLVRTLFYLSFS